MKLAVYSWGSICSETEGSICVKYPVNAQTHADVKTLSKTLNMELGEFVKHSAVYFKKTGIDPSKSENESPHKVMKELVTRVGQVVAYIKTHEQEKLNPLLDQLII